MSTYINLLPFDLIPLLSCCLSYRTCHRFLTLFSIDRRDQVWRYKIRNELNLPDTTFTNTILPLDIRYLELKASSRTDFGTELFYYLTSFCQSLTEMEVLEIFGNFKDAQSFPEFLCIYYSRRGEVDKFITTYLNYDNKIWGDPDETVYTTALNSPSPKIVEFIKEVLDKDEVLDDTETALHYITGNTKFVRENIQKDCFFKFYHAARHKQWQVIDYLISQNVEISSDLYTGLIESKNCEKIEYYFSKYSTYEDSEPGLMLDFVVIQGLWRFWIS